MCMWMPAGPKDAEKESAKQTADPLNWNRYAILAAVDEPVFSRQVRNR